MKKLLLLLGWFICFGAWAQSDSLDIKLKRLKELQQQGLEDSSEYKKIRKDVLGGETAPQREEEKDKRFYIGFQGGPGLATIFNNSTSQLKFKPIPSWAAGIGLGYNFRRFGGLMLQVNYIRRGYIVKNPPFTTQAYHTISRYREDVIQIPVIFRSRSRGKLGFVADGGFAYNYALRSITDYTYDGKKYATQLTRSRLAKPHDGEFLLGFGIMARTRVVDVGFTIRNNFSLTTRYYSMQARLEINFPFAIEKKEKSEK